MEHHFPILSVVIHHYSGIPLIRPPSGREKVFVIVVHGRINEVCKTEKITRLLIHSWHKKVVVITRWSY